MGGREGRLGRTARDVSGIATVHEVERHGSSGMGERSGGAARDWPRGEVVRGVVATRWPDISFRPRRGEECSCSVSYAAPLKSGVPPPTVATLSTFPPCSDAAARQGMGRAYFAAAHPRCLSSGHISWFCFFCHRHKPPGAVSACGLAGSLQRHRRAQLDIL